MNEWKELQIDDLPSDILTGDYEVQQMSTSINDWMPCSLWIEGDRGLVINKLFMGWRRYRIRRSK